MDQTQIKANTYADPLALAQLIDALDGRDGYEMHTAAKEARQYLDGLLTQIAHRSQASETRSSDKMLTVTLSDRDWLQTLSYIAAFKDSVEAMNGEEEAPRMISYRLAEEMRHKILAQLRIERAKPKAPSPKPISEVAEEIRALNERTANTIDLVKTNYGTKDFPFESLDIVLNAPLPYMAVGIFQREGLGIHDVLFSDDSNTKIQIQVMRRKPGAP